jgi:hypothetical protein
MTHNLLKILFLIFILTNILSGCDEDFDVNTEYTDQTVVYAFLEQNDDLAYLGLDTNWVVVNKAFLGEANVDDMAAVSDSVNYSNYDEIEVTLQRIKSLDPNSGPVGEGVLNH